MVKEIINSSEAVPPLPTFSHAVKSDGKIYVSGSIGCDREWKLIPGGVQAQTRAALENMSKILQASGSDLQHVVKVNAYLTSMQRDFGPMNEVYLEFFAPNPPARTCVGVLALPMGADVEFECVAEVI